MPTKTKSDDQDSKSGRKRNRRVASSRNDEAGCVWDASSLAPLFERREANETERLRDEVERLQRLVDVLVSARPPSEVGLPPLPPPPYPFSNDERQPVASISATASGAAASPANAQQQLQQPPKEEPQILEAEDLVRRLSELTIRTFQLGGEEAQDPHGESLVKEAKHLLDASVPVTANSSQEAAKSIPDFLSLFPTSATPTDTQELVGRLPPKKLIEKAVDAYFRAISWYIHPITRTQYQGHEDLVYAAKEADKPAPPNSLAIVFAVSALGLFASDLDAPAYAGYDKTDLAVKLVELGRNALAIGRFLEQPTTDAIRALILIATHYAVLAPGDDGGCGMGLLALAVNACLQLELHRDPDKRPGNLPFAEAEDRRRLFWGVFLKDVEIASVMGRRFTLLHVRDCDTKFPLDISDDQLAEESPQPTGKEGHMTALIVRMKFAKLTEQITEEVFGIHAVTYTRILELDDAIRNLEKELPAVYQLGASSDPLTASKALIVNLALLQEILRLHRPFLARSYFDDKFTFSRTTCVNTARQILELQESPLLRASWACMMYKSIMASTVLCVDLMHEGGSEQAGKHKDLVRGAMQRLKRFQAISTICRRGSALLRFLLDKIDTAARDFRPNEGGAPPHLKRTRTAPSGTRPALTASPQATDLPPEPELAHKLPRASSFSTSPFPTKNLDLPLGSEAPRPTHPYPSSRPKTSSSNASRVPSLDFRSDASTSGTSGPSSNFSSFPSSAFLPTTPSMRSAADEIASLDFPALLGIDGNAAPFSFDFSPSASSAASASPAVSTIEARSPANARLSESPVMAKDVDDFTNVLHDGGAWSSFASLDQLAPSSSVFAAGHAQNAPDDSPFAFVAPSLVAPAMGGNDGRLAGGGGGLASEYGSPPVGLKTGRWVESEWADWLRGI
ncbi:hypothetical protein JCM6882_000803 [Rhodosporidiobolus microsporus]